MIPLASKPPIQSRMAALPFQAQHRVLAAVQRRLEQSIFDFAKAWHPELCQSKNWDCAERVELHTAFRALEQDGRGCLAANAAAKPKETVESLRANVAGIRHAAVHRERQSHRQLLQKLDAAHRFVTVWLGDAQCGTELQRYRLRVDVLFHQWKKRSRCTATNLDVRIGLLKDSDKTLSSERYRCLLLEAARRLTQKHRDDCIAQVDRIVHITFPGSH